MAQTCSGETAAGDPSRSGIMRANAYFNAASAYNSAAEAAAPAGLCAVPGTCFQTALTMIDQSVASQQDGQIRPTSNAAASSLNERFKLRRAFERARALRGLSASASASCGSADSCLAEASTTLNALHLPARTNDEDEDARTSDLTCRILDLRWRVNSDIGRAQEFQYVDDLQRIVSDCPSLKNAAADKLAEISFERAERTRQSLASSGHTASELASLNDTALGALTDYRDALDVGRFRLPSYRGMGDVYQMLADFDSSNARTHLADAISAYQKAVDLDAQPADPSAKANDLEQLGTSQLALTKLTRDDAQADALLTQATQSLQQSVAIGPTPVRYLRLGDALERTGHNQESATAYKAAIGGLTGQQKLEATLSLARVLDKTGDAAGALAMLEQASAQGPLSSDVEYEIGARRFARGDLEKALPSILRALPGLTDTRRAEAHYMASVAETSLRREGWQERAFDHAEQAARSGIRAWKYTRQDCLATILLGGDAVKDGSAQSRCPSVQSPDGQLLRGMFLLKQAQLMDVSAYDMASQTRWRSVLRSAEDTFHSGQALLPDAPDFDRVVRFDDLGRDVDMATTLDEAQTVVRRCRREISLSPGDSTWDDLNAFFGHYGVLKCSAR